MAIHYRFDITESERLALLDIVMMVMHPPVQLEVCVDVVRQVETRPADLLQRLLALEPEPPDCTCAGGEQGDGLCALPHDPSCPVFAWERRVR